MKLTLEKEEEIGGRIWLHFKEDNWTKQSWRIDNDAAAEITAKKYFEEAKERLSKGFPKRETVLEFDTETVPE